jgi:transglutaminase-like putative cysteine protease
MNPIRRACLAACAALSTGAVRAWAGLPPSSGTAGEEGRVRRRLRFVVAATNPSSQELLDQTVWLYMPAHAPQRQRLIDVRASTENMRVLDDALGHRIVRLDFARIAPLARKIVNLTAEVELRSEGLQEPGSAAEWLAGERHIETGDLDVRSLAHELRRPEPSDTAQAIYEWIRGHLAYEGYVAEDRGAAYALKQRRGDCTEYAYLAAALARVNGIPARMVGGYVVTGDSVPRPQDYHNWTEVHLNGQWKLLDAQKERWLSAGEDYVAFRYYRDAVLNPVGLAHRFKATDALQVQL